MIKPISPEEVVPLKKEKLPEIFLEIINSVIAKNWDGVSSEFTYDDLLKESKLYNLEGQKLQLGYTDFGAIYEAEGWKISVDRPGFNETYSTMYEFKKKKK